MKQATAKEFIAGTTGGKDYLVVTRTASLAVGVKGVLEPIVKDETPKLLIGMRVRVVPVAGANVLNVGHTAIQTFPKFTFQKTENPAYCSSFVGSVTDPFPKELTWDEFAETLNGSNFLTSMVDVLGPLMEVSEFYYTKEELVQHIKESFEAVFTAPQDTTPKVKGTILPFPTLMGK